MHPHDKTTEMATKFSALVQIFNFRIVKVSEILFIPVFLSFIIYFVGFRTFAV